MVSSRKPYYDMDETILSFPWEGLSFWEFSSLLFRRKLVLQFKFLCSVAERMNFQIYQLLIHCFLFGIYGHPTYQGVIPGIKSFVLSSRNPYFDKDETILSFPWKTLSFWGFSSFLFSRKWIMKFKFLCPVAGRMNSQNLSIVNSFFSGIYGYLIYQGFNPWITYFVLSCRKPYLDKDETILSFS